MVNELAYEYEWHRSLMCVHGRELVAVWAYIGMCRRAGIRQCENRMQTLCGRQSANETEADYLLPMMVLSGHFVCTVVVRSIVLC